MKYIAKGHSFSIPLYSQSLYSHSQIHINPLKSTQTYLLSFSNNETSSGIGDLDVEFLGTLDNDNAILGGNVMSDFSSINAILHHEHFEFGNVTNDNLTETGGKHMLSSLGATVTDRGHRGLSGETTTDTVIDTLGLAPGFVDRLETVGLVTFEGLGALLDNGRFTSGRDHL